MEEQGMSTGLRRLLYGLAGVVALAFGVLALELAFPADPTSHLPPIVPTLERLDERTILLDAGLIDRVELRFDGDEPVASVDGIYRCLDTELRRWFGPDSPPQGATRWSRRLEVGRRIRITTEQCDVTGRG